MIVKKMQPIGNFEEYSVDGVTLHLGERVMDLDTLQKDDQVIIDIMQDGRFVANVIIPPAMYEASDAQTADGDPLPPPVKFPVDMDAVKLILWDKPILTIQGE
jgi:hypothetical protein